MSSYKEFDIHKIRFGLAQKYGLPESEIDESVIALYVLLDKGNEELKTAADDTKKQVSELMEELKIVLDKKHRAVIYDDPKAAFWGNFGSKGLTAIALSLALILFGFFLSNFYHNRTLVRNLEKLAPYVQVTDKGYFIPKSAYESKPDGILIRTE